MPRTAKKYTAAHITLRHAEEVHRITGLSADSLSELIYVQGERYAKQEYAPMYEPITRSRMYWNWFKMLWNSHDAEFVALYASVGVSRGLYEQFHEQRLKNAYIDSIVLMPLMKEMRQSNNRNNQ